MPATKPSSSPSDHRSRDIPWLQVVKFHKEIVTRGEEGFFALNGKDDQSDRWSSLLAFDAVSLVGPWALPATAFQSRPFRLALDQGQSDSLFLGGPCYLKWSKPLNGDFIPQWCPLLYREVAGVRTQEGLEVTPLQGKWSLSPLVLTQISRSEMDPGCPLEELGSNLIEVATQRSESTGQPLHQAILEALASRFPSLAAELTGKRPGKDTFKVLPSPWVLFRPTQQFSAMNRYLMKDYEQLEANLTQDPKGIGGLKLLEDRPSSGGLPKKAELLPLVPLNRVQKEAVQQILDQRSLTVISGPPGTGKSQIVVSLLLNAWAQGKSVLFASNNNKAVDVVRERVEKFESQFPIAVRAGAKNKQNISEVLRRTLNMAGARGAAGDLGEGAAKALQARKKLVEEKQQLEANLASHTPQRIGEARKAALTAYGLYQGKCQEHQEKLKHLLEEQEGLGFQGVPAGDIEKHLCETRSWLASIERAKNLAEEDARSCAELVAKRNETAGARNREVEKAGLQPSQAGDWLWLVNGPDPSLGEEWEQRYRASITSSLDPALEPGPWDAAYDAWETEGQANAFAMEAEALLDAIERLRTEILPKAKELEQLDADLSGCRERLLALELTEAVRPPLEGLEAWSSHYGEWVTLEEGRFDFLPWSRRAKLEQALKRDFRQIRPHLPLEVLTRLGSLREDLHHQLRPLVSCLVDWSRLITEVELAKPKREALERTLGNLRHRCGHLKVGPVPAGAETEAWTPVAAQLAERYRLAHAGALAWRRRVEKDSVEKSLRVLAQEWLRFAGGIPIREAWRKGKGMSFEASIQSLADEPGLESLKTAREHLYSGVLTKFLEVWRAARVLQQDILGLEARQGEIPLLADRIQAWHAKKPTRTLVKVALSKKEWPPLEESQAFLDRVMDWMVRWTNFLTKETPVLEQEKTKELNWALEKLQAAVDLLPETQAKVQVVRMVKGIQATPHQDWPTKDLHHVFTAFSAERMRGRIEQIDVELERTAFNEAKDQWRARLKEDTQAIRAVDALEKSLRNRPEVLPTDYGTFKQVLRLVPIWITTAQAAQAIPLLPEIFDIVVIDEASQCTLTNLLPLMYRGRSLTVIGDDQQLPAIPTIREAEELALARKCNVEPYLQVIGHVGNDVYKAATEALPRRRADVIMLEEHFRCHAQIIGFSNRHIYNQRLELKKDPHAENRLPVASGLYSKHVSGTAARGKNNKSWRNEQEGKAVLEIVKTLKGSEDRTLEIGIVTPFAAQKLWLQENLEELGMSSGILVDTANGFQGDERDVIIFSPVVAKGMDDSAARWVEAPPNLINVAITRAREVLYVVGDLDCCKRQSGILNKLAAYCKEIQLLRDTSVAELELFSWLVLKGWEPLVHPRVGDLEVDFILKDKKGRRLALEVDGGDFHSETNVQDKSRDAYLMGQGYEVLRFEGREVMETPFEVLHRIEEALNTRS